MIPLDLGDTAKARLNAAEPPELTMVPESGLVRPPVKGRFRLVSASRDVRAVRSERRSLARGGPCFTAGTMIGTPVCPARDPGFIVASAQHMSGTPGARRLAVCALERTAERFLGIVANPAGDDADAQIGRRQEVLCEVHPPLGEVPDRRPAEDFAESGIEHGP